MGHRMGRSHRGPRGVHREGRRTGHRMGRSHRGRGVPRGGCRTGRPMVRRTVTPMGRCTGRRMGHRMGHSPSAAAPHPAQAHLGQDDLPSNGCAVNHAEYLQSIHACTPAIEYARRYPTLATAWDACDNLEWLLWLCDRALTPQQRTLLACDVAETALPYAGDGETLLQCLFTIHISREWAAGREDDETLDAALDAAGETAGGSSMGCSRGSSRGSRGRSRGSRGRSRGRNTSRSTGCSRCRRMGCRMGCRSRGRSTGGTSRTDPHRQERHLGQDDLQGNGCEMNDRRFHAACAAMQGLLTREDFYGSTEGISKWAVREADARLRASRRRSLRRLAIARADTPDATRRTMGWSHERRDL